MLVGLPGPGIPIRETFVLAQPAVEKLLLVLKLLPVDEAQATLPAVKDWKKQSAEIRRTFQFKDCAQAMEFVNRVAGAAEAANHHPDIDIRWNKVTLALATHSEGGLTQNDFDLAKKIDALAKA